MSDFKSPVASVFRFVFFWLLLYVLSIWSGFIAIKKMPAEITDLILGSVTFGFSGAVAFLALFTEGEGTPEKPLMTWKTWAILIIAPIIFYFFIKYT